MWSDFCFPENAKKLEFLAVRINLFWLAASFDVKKLVKSQQKLLAASLKIPQLRSMTIASDRRKYIFFRKNHLIFLSSTCLTGYFKVLIWTYGWFLWPKLVLRHLRNCPRVKLKIKFFLPGNPIS